MNHADEVRRAGSSRLCPGAVRHARGRRFVTLSEKLGSEGAADGQRLLANGSALAAGPEAGLGGMPTRVAELFGKPAATGVVVGNPPLFLTAVPDAGPLDRFAQSYGAGDAALQQGNPINRVLLERAGELAALDPGPRSAAELRDAGSTTFDGLPEHLVTAGGRDQESVHGMVIDPDSREDKILPLLQQDRSNSGEASVSRMFEWVASDATAGDDDPVTIERAMRAGETAFGLSQLLAGHHADLLDVPGSEGKSIGELNPAVTHRSRTGRGALSGRHGRGSQRGNRNTRIRGTRLPERATALRSAVERRRRGRTSDRTGVDVGRVAGAGVGDIRCNEHRFADPLRRGQEAHVPVRGEEVSTTEPTTTGGPAPEPSTHTSYLSSLLTTVCRQWSARATTH